MNTSGNLAHNMINSPQKQEMRVMEQDIEWIQTNEAAEIMGVALSTVSRLCRQGKINCKQFGQGRGSVWFVDKASAEAYEKTVGGRGKEIDFTESE